jgi:hypothetical protein
LSFLNGWIGNKRPQFSRIFSPVCPSTPAFSYHFSDQCTFYDYQGTLLCVSVAGKESSQDTRFRHEMLSNGARRKVTKAERAFREPFPHQKTLSWWARQLLNWAFCTLRRMITIDEEERWSNTCRNKFWRSFKVFRSEALTRLWALVFQMRNCPG